MGPDKRNYAAWGLYLAVISLIAAFGFAIIQRAWTTPVQLSLGAAIFGLAFFAALDPDRMGAFFAGRQARRGSRAVIRTLLVFVILGVVNYLGYKNSYRWDVTADKTHTLALDTREILLSLPNPVTALAFYSGISPSEQVQELLEDFKFSSAGSFRYEFINMAEEPLTAQQFGISCGGTILLQMGDQHEQVTYANEREMAGALIRLMNPGTKSIYFLTGHGELDPEGVGDKAYAYARRVLRSKNYAVEKLNLLALQQIPDEVSILVIAGPKKPISELEIDLLAAYLQEGGSLLVLAEPRPMTAFEGASDPLADYLEDAWGIQLGDDLVIDLTSNQPFTAVANQYGSHLITDKMQGLISFFPEARSVSANQQLAGIEQVELVLTASQSWAERDLEAVALDQELAPDEGVDLLGPVSLAAAAEDLKSRARVVVFGDADFASDSRFNAYGNGDLFVNAVDWAAEQENLISLTPREQTPRILIPPNQTVFNLITFLLVFILPGTVILVGGYFWYQRRSSPKSREMGG